MNLLRGIDFLIILLMVVEGVWDYFFGYIFYVFGVGVVNVGVCRGQVCEEINLNDKRYLVLVLRREQGVVGVVCKGDIFGFLGLDINYLNG